MLSSLKTNGRINLHHALRAVSIDVITDYAFDYCYDFLENDDFGGDFFNMARDMAATLWLFQFLPSIRPVAFAIPFWLAKLTSKALTRMKMFQEVTQLFP